MKNRIALCTLAIVSILSLTGCGDDPSGTPIYANASGSTSGAYTANAGYQQVVYSGGGNQVIAAAEDNVRRDDGGSITNTGTASLIFTQQSSGYTFRGSFSVSNLGGGAVRFSASLRWSF